MHVKARTWYLWVDDLRPFPKVDESRFAPIICRSYNAAIDAIDFCVSENWNFILDLDHDLGEAKTGYDIAKYLVEKQIKNVTVYVHSMNPVEVNNILELLNHYHYSVTSYLSNA